MIRYDFLEKCSKRLWVNFTLGKFSVVRKPIVNGGAIRPGGLLLTFLAQLMWQRGR